MKNTSREKEPSRVFQDLSSKKISDITLEDYNKLTEVSFLEAANNDFLADLATVIQFQQKPKGLQLTKVEQSGLVDSSSNVTLLEIPAGKTYDIQAVTAILTSGSSEISYLLNGIPPLGLDYLIKTMNYTTGQRGITIDFSSMGDFLLSGQQDASAFLVAKRQSGTGSVGAHNVFYREVN